MHNFKKALTNTISLVLSFVIVFIIVIYPCFEPESQYNDSVLRQSLSGKIDYVFSGASHTYQAINPNIIDEELGVCSYNLSSPSASMEGRYALLEKEMLRNKLDMVVIDVSFDSLVRSQSAENATGEPMIFFKLGELGESIKYLFSHVSLLNNDIENVISIFMRYGLKAWKDKITGNTGMLQKNKGFLPESTNDVYLENEKIIATYNSCIVNTDFSEHNLEILTKTIDLCKQNDVRVVVAVMPISDAAIWKYTNLDDFLVELKMFCSQNDCQVFDFNLMHNRHEILSDKTSFNNLTHMSEEGATVFSKAFCDFMKKYNSDEDVSNMFYSSYADMKNASPYMSYYMSYVENAKEN